MQVEHLKRWLESYQERQRDLESSYERLERLESKLTSPRSAALTGLPGAAAPDPDRLTLPLAELQELQAETKRQAAAQVLYRQIDNIIAQIHGPGWPDMRFVLRARYLDLCAWPQISEMLFRRKLDFEGKEDTYLRRCFAIHKKALVDLLELYNGLLRGSDDHET